ncbi:MAG: efflux RND transporter periplasmic adaptor subunit [Sphingobacterium sp.]|jgi:RND family efflux transporter MFP subunit|nr:efflux RND transporter periplasmic adaptor subunit [Sphingobacterium sp.]
MKTKSITIFIAIAVIALIAIKLTLNKKKINKSNQIAKSVEIRIPVKVTKAKEQALEVSILKTGSLMPFKEAKALAVAPGNIQQLRFELGDQVSQGQVLAITDTRSLKLSLEQAESAASKLKNDLTTYSELLQGNAASKEQVNNLRQQYNDAINKVDQARKNLNDAAVKAPTSGIISAKPVEEGVFVNAGAEIATIVNLSKAKVKVFMTETEVYQIINGQSVKITTEVYPDKVFQGEVSFISPQADQARNYLVEVSVNNTGKSLLRSGTFVYADFSKKSVQNVTVIPREALTESTKETLVYVVENGIVKSRPVKVGANIGGMVQIIDGLKPDEVVVTSGQINLSDGTKVSISK